MRSLSFFTQPTAATVTTTPYLPPEVWEHISQYLSWPALRKWRHLNHACYHLYLKAQYDTVYINWNKCSKKKIDFLCLFHKYVHHLVIDSFVIGYELLAAPSLITNLHSLTLKLPDGLKRDNEKQEKRNTQFYSTLWRTIGPNLKHLSLFGFASYNANIYLPSPSLLPSLERLTFDDQREWSNCAIDAAWDKKAQFIGGLAPQLRVFEIDFPLSRVAPNAPVFSSLEQLSLRICALCTEELGLNLIVSYIHHRRPLQLHLTIEGRNLLSAERMSRFVSELNSAQRYVELRSLKFVEVPFWVESVTYPLRELIPLYHSTVRNLDVAAGQTDLPVNNMYLPEFVTTVSTYGQLSSLTLNIETLDVDWLISLSSKFPNIESLRLYVLYIADKGFVNTIDVEPSLRAWKLYDLGIYHDLCRLDNDWMKLIARLIPSVGSFWGEGHMERPIVEDDSERSTAKSVWQQSLRAMWRSSSYMSFASKTSFRGKRKGFGQCNTDVYVDAQ